MTIKLISKEQYDLIRKIQKKFPVLTFQNKGYEYIRTPFNNEEQEAFDKVSEILKNHIKGFSKFNNFRKKGKIIELRFQYRWDESFTGVGYIKLFELLNGFRGV